MVHAGVGHGYLSFGGTIARVAFRAEATQTLSVLVYNDANNTGDY